MAEPTDRHPSRPRRPGLAAGDAGQPLAGRRDRGREGDPGQGRRRREPLLRRVRVLRRPQPPAGRASTCPASRRSSARRSTRSCWARPSRPRCWPPTSPRRCASARAACGPRSRSPRATRRRSPTPESGKSTQEIYVLFGTAVDSEHGTRTLTGVQAQGMTACPCAQEMVAGLSRERLAAEGFERRGDRARRRRRPDRHPQPARHRHPPRRLPRGRPGLDRRAGAAADRRELDELGDLRADEAPRRDVGRRQGARKPALRRGLRARDGAPGGRGLPRPPRRGLRDGAPGEPGDDPPPQRGGRALRHPRRAAGRAGQRRAARRAT